MRIEVYLGMKHYHLPELKNETTLERNPYTWSINNNILLRITYNYKIYSIHIIRL